MPPKRTLALNSGFFWFTAAAATLSLYWLSLYFFFPKYFAPLSAFHIDFYVYVGAGEKTFLVLLQRYPRPVSFLAMKLLAYGGLMGLMAGGIAIALLNVLLTLAIARKVFGLYSPWLLASFCVYAFLLFAHPEFYVEHRHDLPAQVSYLFLAISLLAWVTWVQTRTNRLQRGVPLNWRIPLLGACGLSAVLFVFAKESYFVAALFLVAGLALADRAERWRHAVFLAFLLGIECCSFAWNMHINGPFVNPNAGTGDTYRISLAPGSLVHSVFFYLAHFWNPGFVLMVCLALLGVWRDRRQFVLATAFVLAGLSVILPHAILPNHLFEEYAWAAAPLFLAPVLLICQSGPSRWLQPALAAMFVVLAVIGPFGYRTKYNTAASRWTVAEDRKGGELARSLSSYKGIRRPARILVVGLEDSSLPWESRAFVGMEFGDGIVWTVLLPRQVQSRQNSRLVRFTDAADVQPGDFDYVASYRADESLASIRAVTGIPSSEPRDELLVPALAALHTPVGSGPPDCGLLLRSAAVSIDWGLWGDGERFLERARRDSRCAGDTTYRRLFSELQARPPAPTATSQAAELTARPESIIQPDGSGLAETELFWKAPDGVFCEIHVDAPDGALFESGEKSGHIRTGKWVRNGMRFFLQDVTGGKPLTKEHTLAQIKLEVTL